MTGHKPKYSIQILVTCFTLLIPLLTRAQSPSMKTQVDSAPPSLTETKSTLVAKGQDEINLNPLKASAQLGAASLEAGKPVVVQIQLDLDSAYKAYVDKFALQLADDSMGAFGPLKVAPIQSIFDKFSKKQREIIHDRAEITTTLTIQSLPPPGASELPVLLTYQACSDTTCLLPKKLPLKVAATFIGPASPAGPGAFDVQGALSKGLLYTLLLAFGFGVLTSLTPCIFPMIPITLSVIGARSHGQSRLRGFSLSFVYSLGIALTYATLGVISARAGAIFGAALSKPPVVWTLAVVFVLMGLSMYGAFELQVPAFIRNRLGRAKSGPGFVGAFVAGLVAGIVASPCVGPVLVSILTFVAKTQDMTLGFMILFSFAMGIGFLFMILGTFTGLLTSLPRSGKWMDLTKFLFGTTMIGMALYYIEAIVPKEVHLILVGTASILIASAFGVFGPQQTPIQKLRKGFMILAFAAGTTLVGSATYRLIYQTPQDKETAHGTADTHNLWQDYSEVALLKAHQEGRPVMIDFWADWCAACKELEKFTFSDPAVSGLLAKFTLMKVDATNENEDVNKILEKYQVVGLPTLIFFGPTGDLRADLTVTGYEGPEEFLKRLKKISP